MHNTNVNVYIYIYMCVCVCVSTYVLDYSAVHNSKKLKYALGRELPRKICGVQSTCCATASFLAANIL